MDLLNLDPTHRPAEDAEVNEMVSMAATDGRAVTCATP
jgi:hypothetical protein